MRATHDFLTEDDIVALRPLVAAALDDDALELWVLTGPGDQPVGFMGLAGEDVSALSLEPARRREGGGRGSWLAPWHCVAALSPSTSTSRTTLRLTSIGRSGPWSSVARRSTTAGDRSRCCICVGRLRPESTI